MPTILILHILTSSVGYLLFGTAFCAACLYLYRSRRIKTKQITLKDRFPGSLRLLDSILFRSLKAGVLLMGIGLLLGLATQKAMNGALDLSSPRLLFPFTIWVFYLAVLLVRFRTGMGGKVQAHLTACGLMCSVISFCYEIHLTAS